MHTKRTAATKADQAMLTVTWLMMVAVIASAGAMFSLGCQRTEQYIAPNDAMAPTFNVGSTLVGQPIRDRKEIRKGSVVLFRSPKAMNNKALVKRIIAMGGDFIEIDSNRKIFVNRQELKLTRMPDAECSQAKAKVSENSFPEESLCFYEENGSNKYPVLMPNRKLEFTMGPYPLRKLAADELFVLGDNRVNSADSRAFGPIHERDVVAVIRNP